MSLSLVVLCMHDDDGLSSAASTRPGHVARASVRNSDRLLAENRQTEKYQSVLRPRRSFVAILSETRRAITFRSGVALS